MCVTDWDLVSRGVVLEMNVDSKQSPKKRHPFSVSLDVVRKAFPVRCIGIAHDRKRERRCTLVELHGSKEEYA